MSKRALVAYADALRHEVGTHVGVGVVYPSMVASPIHHSTAEAGRIAAGDLDAAPLAAGMVRRRREARR
ncbi:hypothetical protein [Micromonospora sp. NPDC005299]|uniref:hypothetical protein n=1 Tax=Micromonospora sp. NPDC005299 TaxID=3364231 RepID=UPI0036BD39BB